MKNNIYSNDEYSDIINRNRPVSLYHIPMSRLERAAQFAPFSALNGYENALIKARESKNERILRFDESISEINRKIKILSQNVSLNPEVSIVFFDHDETSNLGEYKKISSKLEKIDEIEKRFVFKNGLCVDFKDVYSLESEAFEDINSEQ